MRTESAGDLRLDGADRALFASDMHLGAHAPALGACFARMLEAHLDGVTDLFLLGDLFEAWVGDDAPDDAALGLAAWLHELSRQGLRVRVLRGNRDFLLGVGVGSALRTDFCERAGMSMIPDPTLLTLWGQPVMLAHGDALCTDDHDYMRFRALSRSPGWQQEFLALRPAERRARARDYRDASEASKTGKSAELMDVNQDAVDAAMDAAGVDRLIHGHTHRPAVHRWTDLGRARERWVLPDWSDQPQRGGLLRVDAQGWRCLGNWPDG